MPLGLAMQGLGRRRRVTTRKPGDLPERRHPSGVRGARSGRTSAAVTKRLVTRMEAATTMLAHIPSTEIAKTRIVKAKFGYITISAALTASALALAITYAESAKADGAMLTKAPPIPYVGSSDYNWNGFYAGGNLGLAWGRSNWTAGPGLSGTNNLFQTIDTFDEAGSFYGRLAGRLQLRAAKPHPPRRRSGCIVSSVSNAAGGRQSFRPLDWRYFQLQFADTRPRQLRRNGAGLRHRARPRRLRAGALAVLCHRRLRLDIQSTVADPDRNRQQRHSIPMAIGLGGRSRRRSADRAALDRAPGISVHRLRQDERHISGNAANEHRLSAPGTASRFELPVRQRLRSVRCADRHQGRGGARAGLH